MTTRKAKERAKAKAEAKATVGPLTPSFANCENDFAQDDRIIGMSGC
jgi:hypothetical protein